MREQIETLATLQNVDREIKEKNDAKAVLLSELQKREVEIEAKKAETAALMSEWKERDKVRQEKEKVLQEEGRKAVEKRMRMTRIKNIKELQALQREIDQIKQGNAQLEEELIKVMEELEACAASLKGKEEELKRAEEERQEGRGVIESKVVGLEQAIAEAATIRKTLAEKLNGDLMKRYDLIFSRRGGTAVVTVSDGICQGCYMNIPPQLWNEIIKSERLNLCPSCHRILYYKPTIPNDKQL